MKRFTAWMLVILMIFSVMPSSVFAADVWSWDGSDYLTSWFESIFNNNSSNEDETDASVPDNSADDEISTYDTDGTVLDAAIFCSDVHGSASELKEVLGGVKTSGVTYSALGLVGDTALTISNVNSTVNSALGYTPNIVYSYAASHDTENSADISTDWNFSGEAFENDNYIIYTIRETDMQTASNASTAAAAFTKWANTADTTKPVFIISHRPLHVRRNDNKGAATWYEAISAAAEKMDIVFFWAHNHTSESDADTNAYYVEKDGSETITIQGGDTVVPNFTYMNAGYINANNQRPARRGVATTVQITADSLIFQDYNSSGAYTGTYAHNVTVERKFAVTAPTLASIAISGTTEYNVGDELELTVTATYSDDTTEDVTAEAILSGYDMSTAGTQTVTATYGEKTATIEIIVEAAYVTSIDVTTLPTKTTYDIGETLDTSGMVVTATYSNDTTAEVTGWYTSFVDMTTAGEKTVTVNYAVDGITFKATFTIKVEEQVAEDATLTSLKITTDPVKTEYLISEALDITGMVVEAKFSDGTVKTLSYVKFADDASDTAFCYDIEDFNMYVAKKQEVVVTYTYGDVTLTDSFNINVFAEDFTDEATDVKIQVTDYGVIAISVSKSTNENVSDAIAGVISGEKYVAYDILLTFDEGYSATNSTKTVTLPIPDGVTNPVVYYVSDDGATVTNMNATKGNGAVTFETTHFSTYVVGESAEITVPDPNDATVEGATTTEEKTVYVKTSKISSGESYLIVNGDVEGDYYALANNSGSVSATNVKIKTGSTTDGTVTYIELKDATDELWIVGTGYTFKNGSYYLSYSSSGNWNNKTYALKLKTSKQDWSLNNSSLYFTDSYFYTRYLTYNSGWSLSSSSSKVYFYEKQTVQFETSANGTYSIAGTPDEVSKVVVNGTTATLGSTLTFVPENGTSATTDASESATYTVVEGGDPNGIISGISGNTVTFSGNYGTALVRVSYTITINGTAYTVDNYIKVTATEPTYTIEITETEIDDDGNRSAGEVITETIVIKGETAINAGYDLWVDVTCITTDGVNESYVVDTDKLTWKSSNASIATVDPDGKVTFTGNEGTVQITVYYEYADGKSVTDTVTFSVSKKQYVLPEDGTNDFPEYPNQGAIRIDKTAVAVGSFSQTGIAQIELSMTGVPYTTGSEIDVVLMLDMTGSMSANGIAAAEAAAKAFVETIVKNEDGTYNNNRVAVYQFNTNGVSEFFTLQTISSDAELETAKNKIKGTQASGGTPFDTAVKHCHDILATEKAKEGYNRQQFCVFMSDGGPTTYKGSDGYTYSSGNNTSGNRKITSYIGGYTSPTSSDWTYSLPTEYWTDDMKADGVTVYTVGLLLQNVPSNPSPYAEMTASSYNSTTDSLTTIGSHYYFTSTILKAMASDSSKYIDIFTVDNADNATAKFTSIASSIREAAKDVVVEDKVDSKYSVNFSLPSGVESTEAGMSEFYIQVVDYVLDSTTHERTSVYTVLENFTFDENGVLKSHTVDGESCGDSCNHVIITNGKITELNGTYFNYVSGDDGEILTWTADKLSSNELALQYFVYLNDSAGDVAAADQVEAGTYQTNEYATITYTNFNGNECQQYFPVPSLTWNGAQVTYVFYLVNENGQPVNRAGKVVPFAEAVYVTEPVTYDVTWNEETGKEDMLAANLFASANVPDVYELYDEEAYYEIRVYQTEGVDQGDNVRNYNYFVIAGSESGLTSKETTKVFNTKAGTKFDDYGVYSAQAKESILYTTDADGKPSTVKVDYQTTDIDYANTTVAFAVVWKPALVEDVVVIDYGLDVVIDVYTNDGLAAGVTGVMLNPPSGVTINSGTYTTSVGAPSIKSTDDVWTASVENNKSVRFHLNNMQLDKPAVFYYEVGVNYYVYDSNNNATLNTTNMYSSVTVIPATTIYYEESFVKFTNSTEYNGKTVTTGIWTTAGSEKTGTQATDRPGQNQAMSKQYDADFIYGYDDIYAECTEYSLGSAKTVTVDETTGKNATVAPVASFDFYGTGFDVVSMTNTDSGVVFFDVYKYEKGDTDYSDNSVFASRFVDSYYGYKYEKTEDGGFEWVVDKDETGAIYQVPLMKIAGLEYDHYHVEIRLMYDEWFNHQEDSSYSFWLDAIRIYDPAGFNNEIANEAYKKDDEYNPQYIVIRNELVKAGFGNGLDEKLEGVVFIDGKENADVTLYENPGPNNETYLANGQGIAFKLTADAEPASVQLGAKLAFGTSATLKITVSGSTYDIPLSTATDMYYDITDYVGWNDLTSDIIVISNANNSGDTVISLTNLKATQKSEESPNIAFFVDGETQETGAYTLRRFFTVSADESETTELFTPESLSYTITKNWFRSGETLTITTSSDVASLTVNGENIEESAIGGIMSGISGIFGTGSTGTKTWICKSGETNGTYDIVAYDENGIESETICAPEDEYSASVKDTISDYIDRTGIFDIMEELAERIFSPETFELNINRTYDGENQLAVNTSEDVEYIIANGEIIDRYITKTVVDLSNDGEETVTRVWVTDVEENEEIEVTAYNEEGVASSSDIAVSE